jgi:glycerophosphoryl diester phosphodiesterase
LTELYQDCGSSFELSLDVKDPAAFGPILAVAATAGAASRLWLCHPDRHLLETWRAATSESRLVESTRLNQIPEGIEARARALASAGVDAVNLHRREWTAASVQAVHGAGLAAFGWDAQSTGQIRALLELEVDGVYSDHVKLLMQTIRAMAGETA